MHSFVLERNFVSIMATSTVPEAGSHWVRELDGPDVLLCLEEL